MSVCQRKDGQWFCQWMEGGKRHRKYFGTGPQGESAARKYNEQVAGISGARIRIRSPLFADLALDYLRSRTNITGDNYRKAFNRYANTIIPNIGQIQAHSVTPARLDRYVAKRRRHGVKLTTIHRELADIRAVLRWAVSRKMMASNPMDGFVLPKRDDAEILPATDAEITALMQHAAPHLIRALLISYYCGLRPGAVELLSIRWDQVDFNAKTITIISANKGGVKSRQVPIHQNLLTQLYEWRKQDGDTPIVVHYHGRQIKSLKTAYKNAKRKAGITRRLPLYAIRHTFVSNLLRSGAAPKAVADMTGHDIRTMLNWYAKTCGDEHRKTIDLLHPLGAVNAVGAENYEAEKET